MNLPAPTPFAHKCMVPQEMDVKAALKQLDLSGVGILLVVDADGVLKGVVTDGDIRRAILNGKTLDGSIAEFMNASPLIHVGPIRRTDALTFMHTARTSLVDHLPIVDEDGHVYDLITSQTAVASSALPARALILAGGFGRRLGALTDNTPKPMLPIADHPLAEHIILALKGAGIPDIWIAVHHLSGVIIDYFGDGHRLGVHIDYIKESEPLGTAGSLSLVPDGTVPTVMVNGDVLTKVDFRSMLEFHQERRADITVAVHPHSFQIPYGVVTTHDIWVTGITEKPVVTNLILAGVYVVAPSVPALMQPGQHCDMPDLIRQGLEQGLKVATFPVHEDWIDIGAPDDYRRAQDYATGSDA